MMYNIMAKLVRHKFSITLLDIDWDLTVESSVFCYQQRVINILALQKHKKNNNFESLLIINDKILNKKAIKK